LGAGIPRRPTPRRRRRRRPHGGAVPATAAVTRGGGRNRRSAESPGPAANAVLLGRLGHIVGACDPAVADGEDDGGEEGCDERRGEDGDLRVVGVPAAAGEAEFGDEE